MREEEDIGSYVRIVRQKVVESNLIYIAGDQEAWNIAGPHANNR